MVRMMMMMMIMILILMVRCLHILYNDCCFYHVLPFTKWPNFKKKVSFMSHQALQNVFYKLQTSDQVPRTRGFLNGVGKNPIPLPVAMTFEGFNRGL